MAQNNERPLTPAIEIQRGLKSMASAIAEGPARPVAADRLYQIAALTAGIFLLATLL